MNEWENEPDELTWRDRETGYHCGIFRVHFDWALRGYVEINGQHKLFDVGSNRLNKLNLSNRQLTGALFPEYSWWRIFCKHKYRIIVRYCEDGDLCPKTPPEQYVGRTYRNIAFVKQDVAKLARAIRDKPRQLERIAKIRRLSHE